MDNNNNRGDTGKTELKDYDQYHYKIKNIHIYYDEGFDIRYHEEEDALGIIHKQDPYFRAITINEEIIDCVLDIRIEFSSNKIKVIYEIGVDDTTSGFFSKLLNLDEGYVMYLSVYSVEEKKSFEYFLNTP